FSDRIRMAKDLLVRGKGKCLYKLPNLSDSLALDIFVNGIYEEETHQFLLSRIPPKGIFLDLGANIGSITIPLCKRREDITCIAVEAAPWIFEYLQFNIDANGLNDRVFVVNKAISDTDGGQLPFYSPRNQFGKGSLSPVFTDKAIMVDQISIDGLLKKISTSHVSMIKIDIEGFEYFAFKGGSMLLQSDQAPDIIFEFVDWAEEQSKLEKGSAQMLLQEWGYKLFLMDGKNLGPLKNAITHGGGMIFASKQ
ncbi:MAG TPA: FkbM family methyltransferase, partial [Chitinophagaceae bacterium]|nr:FkbM family methyltransferase [Chitinophagaceae bacterium]